MEMEHFTDWLSQLKYGLSVQVWPSGHANDSEEAIAFTELHNIDCRVEEFPLEKANEAFGKLDFLSLIPSEQHADLSPRQMPC